MTKMDLKPVTSMLDELNSESIMKDIMERIHARVEDSVREEKGGRKVFVNSYVSGDQINFEWSESDIEGKRISSSPTMVGFSDGHLEFRPARITNDKPRSFGESLSRAVSDGITETNEMF